jgi:hypothetical protein
MACGLALLLGGCKERHHSDAFVKASTDFAHLYGKKLDDAYADPAMDAIEAQLASVPADSLDVDAAHALLQRIHDGKAQLAAAAEARAKQLQAANAPVPDIAFKAEPPSGGHDAGAAEDAGLPAHPTAGMPVALFSKLFSDCFTAGQPVNVQGLGMRDTYVLQDFNFCKTQHAGFDQSIVVVDGPKILGVFPKSLLAYPDAGATSQAAPVPDAGTPPSSGGDVPDAG